MIMNELVIQETRMRFVIPAKAGIQLVINKNNFRLDPGFRRGDGQ
jgi:hypothetical protein